MTWPNWEADQVNSFAMIFGHCVWIPPSAKAALLALGLFYGIGITGEPDVARDEALLAGQYVAVGEEQSAARKEVAALNACFATYEVPSQNMNHPEDAALMQRLLHGQKSTSK